MSCARSWNAPATVLLSIAAGLTIEALAGACPPGMAIVRAMPNRPALVGAGITGLYAPAQVGAPARARAERIGTAAGRVVWLRSEAELDLVTALSGSGPAYFFLLAEQLAQAGTALGLARRHRGAAGDRNAVWGRPAGAARGRARPGHG